jgi:DNA-binding CsgD family transcriptional regulator
MNTKKSSEATLIASSLVKELKPPSSDDVDFPPYTYNSCQRNHPEGYIEFPIGHAVIRVFNHDSLSLSYRQRIVLGYAVQGKSDKVIARELSLSPITIKQHLIAIRRHLNAASRSELCFRSILCGLIEIIPLRRSAEDTARHQRHEKTGTLNTSPPARAKPDWGL